MGWAMDSVKTGKREKKKTIESVETMGTQKKREYKKMPRGGSEYNVKKKEQKCSREWGLGSWKELGPGKPV